MSTTLATAMNGASAPKVNDHPTIVRIQAKADEFAKAMPSVMTKDRFMRIAIGAIRKNPKLLECDPLSLMGSLLVAAQLGFEVNTPLGHFFLIPRWNKNTNKMEADGQIGYKGWFDLVARSGRFVSMTAEPVHENDHFIYRLGDEPLIEHAPVLKDRGRAYAYYVSVRVKDGGIFRKVLTRDDVERYRRRSQSPNSPAWLNDFDAMALKTTFLRIVPWLPKSTEMQQAEAFENTVEAQGRIVYREKQGQIDYVIPEPESTPEPEQQIEADDEPAQDDQVVDAEVVETQRQAEPKPASKAPRKRQPAPAPAKPAAQAEEDAPFDDAPAHDPKTRPRPQAPKAEEKAGGGLGHIVAAVDSWFQSATAMCERGGMPDLANRDGLMDWLWAKFVAAGQVSADTKQYYSRVNELAKLAGSTEATMKLLNTAMESVRKDYLGEPEPAAAAPQKITKAPAEAPAGETLGAKVADLDKIFAEWASAFDEANVPAYAMPQNVAHQVYFRAMKSGLVSANAQDYRAKTKDLATIADTAAEIYGAIQPILDAMWNDFVKPEPGSQG